MKRVSRRKSLKVVLGAQDAQSYCKSFCDVMGKAMNIAKKPTPGLDFIVPKPNLGSLTSVHLL